MNNEQIKEKLLQIYPSELDFTVTMTEKKSNRVNGFYRPATQEIFLHNKNFKNDNLMMFTAIHEFAHHVQHENGCSTAKAHNNDFWNTFYTFIDKAEKLGIYTRNRSDSVEKKVEELHDIQKQIIELQKKQAQLLSELQTECEENGDRYEDVIEHDLQISMKKAQEIFNVKAFEEDVSEEMSKTVCSAKSAETRQKVIEAIKNGATIYQAKSIVKSGNKKKDSESEEELLKERRRLEYTVVRLNTRIDEIDDILGSKESA